jgi:hypothetical protein
MLATVMVSAVAAVVLTALAPEIGELLQRFIVQGDRRDLLVGGLFYGAFVGTLMGAVVGLTLVLTPDAPNHAAAARSAAPLTR